MPKTTNVEATHPQRYAPTTSTEKNPQVKVHSHMGTQKGNTSAERKRTDLAAKDHKATTKAKKYIQQSKRAKNKATGFQRAGTCT